MNFKTNTPDFANMTGKALVEVYNEMAHAAVDLGIAGFDVVKRFSTAAAGQQRCNKLHALIQVKVAAAGGDAGNAKAVNDAVTEAAASAEATPFAEDVLVDQYDVDSRLLQTNVSLGVAAAQMGTTPQYLQEGLSNHGFYVVTEPVYIEAVPTGQPPKRSAALAAAIAAAAATPADPVQGEANTNESEEDMAKRRAKATAGRKGSGGGKRSTGGTSIREMTEEYNSIVKGLPAAVKKENPWAKYHNSFFESKEKAAKQLARLKKIA